LCQKQKSTPFQGYQASFRFDRNPGAWGTCHPARRNESCIAVQAKKAATQRRDPRSRRAIARVALDRFSRNLAMSCRSCTLTPLLKRMEAMGYVARIQEQFVADTADGLMVLLIQSDQHEELGISQSRLIKQRFQESAQHQIRRIHCEAKVIFEFWKLFRCHSAHFRSNGGTLARLLMSQIVDARFNRKPLG
jgi:hypothetical protein